jgi:hypothetical protein
MDFGLIMSVGGGIDLSAAHPLAMIRPVAPVRSRLGRPNSDWGGNRAMVTTDDIRTFALSLPRTEEALVRDQVKFRVGRIVYVALSRDERSMGFGFPKDERTALVAAQPEKFFMPIASDLRYNWVRVWLDAIDPAEMRELVVDAWRMVVPKRVAAGYLGDHP